MTLYTEDASASPLLMIETSASLLDAFNTMKKSEVRHLLVHDNDKVVGIVSDRDLLMALQFSVEDLFDYEVTHTSFDPKLTVRHVMSWPVQSIDENASLIAVVNRIIKSKKSSLLITRDESKIVGIVTTQDILNAFRVQLADPSQKNFGSTVLPTALSETSISNILEMLKA